MQENITKFYEVIGTNHLEESGACSIHYWAAKNNVASLQILAQKVSPNSLLITDFDGNSVLHYAVSTGSYDVIEYVVKEFPNLPFYNNLKLTPAHIAAQKGNLRALHLLEKSETMLTSYSSMNWSPLDFAIYFGQLEAVKATCNKDNINKVIYGVDPSLGTFLSHRSLRYCSPYDLSLLVNGPDHPISTYLLEFGGLSSFHASVACHNLQGVTYHTTNLLSSCNQIDATFGERHITALHVAASLGSSDIIHYLLQSRASPNVLDSNHFSALEYAVSAGSLESVKYLHPRTTSEHVTSAAFLAIDFNKPEIARELVINGQLSNSPISDGDTILIRLIKRKMFTVAEEYLKEKSPSLSETDSRGATPLHYAAAFKDKTINLAKDLLTAGAETHTYDQLGLSPLMYGLLTHTTVNTLVESSCIIDKCSFGLNPFALSIILNYPKSKPKAFKSFNITSEVLSQRYNINIPDIINTLNSFEIPSSTTTFPLDLQVSTMENKSISLIQSQVMAVFTGNSPTLFTSRFGGTGNKLTILHIAVIFGCHPDTISVIIKQMHKMKMNLIDDVDDEGRTALQLAVGLGAVNQLNALLKENANMSIRDLKGNTLYHYMLDDVLYPLLSKDEFNLGSISCSEKNDKGEMVFHTTSASGAFQLLRFFYTLCENKSLIWEEDNNGKTPVDFALKCSNLKKRNQCLDFLHLQGVTNRLVAAVTENSIEDAKALIDQGYPADSRDKHMNTPMHIAVASGSLELVKLLLESPGGFQSITLVNDEGLNPIHIAAAAGRKDVLITLLRTNLNMSTLITSDQPYVVAHDAAIKKFLYNYWKRQRLIQTIITQTKVFVKVISKFKAFASKMVTYKQGISIWAKAVQASENILFVGSMLLKSTSKIDYLAPINHYMQVFSSLSIGDYLYTFTAEFNEIIHSIKKESATSVMQMLLPHHIVIIYSKYINQLKNYLLDGIDSEEAFNAIVEDVNAQEQLSTVSLNSNPTQFLQSLSTAYSINTIKECRGNLFMIFKATVFSVTKATDIVFNMQYFNILKEFFPEWASKMPRTIPFEPRTPIQVFVYSDEILLSSRDGKTQMRIPVEMFNLMRRKNSLCFITTLGLIYVSVDKNPTEKIPGEKAKQTEDNSLDIAMQFKAFLTSIHSTMFINDGELEFQESKDKIFQCLVRYMPPGPLTPMPVKVIVVRAGRPEECKDICMNYLSDQLGQMPLNLMIDVRELIPDQSIIIC